MHAEKRSLLLAHGMTDRSLRARTRDGALHRISHGYYADPRMLPTDDDRVRLALRTLTRRAGDDAALAFRTAAWLHKFDGYRDLPNPANNPAMLTGPHSSLRGPNIHRTTTLLPEHRTYIDALPVTSVARTLVELGRYGSADDVEMALESALRSDNPKTPYDWNEDLLEQLLRWPTDPRILGHPVLREVLNRRPPSCRPTGSGAETLNLQGLRGVGLGWKAERQPTVTLVFRDFEPITIFPDDFFPEAALGVEVDGREGHASEAARSRDNHRDNMSNRVIRILRFTATDVLRNQAGVAREIRREYDARVGQLDSGLTWLNPRSNVHTYIRR